MELGAVKSQAWAWYLAAVVFVGQYYVVSAFGAVPNETVYLAVGVSGVVAAVVGLLLHRPPRLLAWLVVAGSIATYLIADAVLASLEEEHVIVPFPSLADWLYLGIYPALAVAFVAIRRSLAPGPDRRAAIDAVLVGVGALGVLGPLYLFDLWNDPFADSTERWIAIAYPVGDALLLGVGARLLFAAGRRVTALTLLAAATGALAVGNAAYYVQAYGDGFQSGGLASVGWLAFTCLLGGAVLHPSVRFAGTSAATARRPWPSFARIASLVAVVGAHLAWGDEESRTFSAVVLVTLLVVGVFRPSRSDTAERDGSDDAVADADEPTRLSV